MSHAVTRRRRRRALALLALVAVAAGGAALWREVRGRRRQERVAALARTRDALRARLVALRAKDPVVAHAPAGDVLVGVPEAVATDLLGQVTASLLRRVEVDLRDVEAHKAGSVRLATPVGPTTAGDYKLRLRIHELRGVLEPGPPKVELRGERLGVALSVRVAGGQARATLDFGWASRGLGRACGDLEARIPVAGRIAPRRYPVTGNFALHLVEGGLAVEPSFEDLAARLQVEPTPETWREFDRVLDRRSARCRAALRLVDVRAAVQGLLDRGIRVKVPARVFRPFRLPFRVPREVRLGEGTLPVPATPRALAWAPRLLWLRVDVREEEAPVPDRGPG